jgi:hypothetical protein
MKTALQTARGLTRGGESQPEARTDPPGPDAYRPPWANDLPTSDVSPQGIDKLPEIRRMLKQIGIVVPDKTRPEAFLELLYTGLLTALAARERQDQQNIGDGRQRRDAESKHLFIVRDGRLTTAPGEGGGGHEPVETIPVSLSHNIVAPRTPADAVLDATFAANGDPRREARRAKIAAAIDQKSAALDALTRRLAALERQRRQADNRSAAEVAADQERERTGAESDKVVDAAWKMCGH